jgi:hypothetical protein
MKPLLTLIFLSLSMLSLGQNDSLARKPLKGAENIYIATDDEVSIARTRIREYRAALALTGKNLGYIEGWVNGVAINDSIWMSGEARPEQEPQIFEATVEKGGDGTSWLRNTDTEYKMLNRVAADHGAVKDGTYPEVTGELKIVSERHYCNSCRGVISQFNKMFPNIKLILVDGAK